MPQLPCSAAPTAICLALVLVAAPSSATESRSPEARPVVHGRVSDADGQALAGVTIRALRAGLSMESRDMHVDDWVEPLVTVTDETGRFEFDELVSAAWTLRAEAADHAPRTVEGARPGELVQIELGPGRRVRGVVLDAANDRPIPGARVTICDPGARPFGRQACRSTETDELGVFAVRGLSRDELQLGAVAPGRAASPLAGLAAGSEEIRGLELRLLPGAGITGRIVDHRERPVEGARVSAFTRGSVLGAPVRRVGGWPVFTDADGRFLHEGLPVGRAYEIRSTRADRPAAEAGPLTLSRAGNLTEIDFVMPAAALLVWRMTSSDGSNLDEFELYHQRSGDDAEFGPLPAQVAPDRIHRDDQGRWTARGMAPGTFDLLIVPDSFAEIRTFRVPLRPGEVTDLGTLVAETGRVLAGRVVEPDGGGVDGASVRAHDGGPIHSVTRRSVTARGGRFSIAGLRDAELTLHVAAPGFIATSLEVTAGESTVEVTLQPSFGIVGRVELEEGGFPPSFSISVYTEAEVATSGRSVGRVKRQGFATEDGSFRVDEIAPGVYTIEARAPGWAPGRVGGVEVVDGETTDLETITLPPGQTLRGSVFASEDGATIVGAAVELREPRGWPTPAGRRSFETVASDASGGFAFQGVEAGEHTLAARHADFAPGEITVRIDADQRERDVVILLDRGGVLTGTVSDAHGQPAPGRTVVLGQSLMDPNAHQARTDPDGVYRIERISPGAYEARLVPAPGSGLRVTTATVSIVEGEIRRLDLDEGSGIRLYGSVLQAGEPLVRSLLFFSPAASAVNLSEMQVTTSDDEGRYEAWLDRPGTYRVMVGTPAAGGSSTQIVVPDESEVARDILLEAEGISGRVLDDEGAPLAGVAVSARREGAAAGSGPIAALLVAESDARGRYTIQGLDPGTYRVTAVAAGFRLGVAFPIELADAAVDAVDFHLERGQELRGVVRDRHGRSVAGAYVLAAPAGTGDPLNAASAETDINGAYRMTAPAEGPLDVTALAPGFAPSYRFGVAPPDPGTAPGLILHVGPGGSLRIVVSDPSGEPASGLYCSVTPIPAYVGSDLGRMLQPIPPTDGDGQVRVEHLAPGSYDVRVIGHPELAPRTVAIEEQVETQMILRLP